MSIDTQHAAAEQGNSSALRGLVYLDNAATSFPKPPQVVDAVRACLDQSLTVQRSTHSAAFRADEVLRRCRAKVARFLGATSPEEIVYTYSATDGLNLALYGMVRPGGHVLVSPLEHHSVMRLLHEFRRSRGISFELLPANSFGVIDPAALRALRRPETCLLAVNWISNVSGTVQPVAELGDIARELELPYLVDASQASGSHKVDVQALHCDVMAQPAHKALYSLPGLGVLYVRQGYTLPSWRIGGTGYKSELLEQPQERPMAYESGTPNVPAIVGLDAAMDWFEATGIETVEARYAALTARLAAGLRDIPGLRLLGPWGEQDYSGERGHLLSFTLDMPDGRRADPLMLAQILAGHYSISSRAGLHCAPTAHRYFGCLERGGSLRLSPGYFCSEADIDYAVGAVSTVAQLL